MYKRSILFLFLFLTPLLFAQSGNLNYLVLRAQFEQDQLATTTGDGLFDLGNESEFNIDKPPHNRTYFQHQMLALKNYFARISNNQLVIEADVLPEGENEVYTLSENMVYYSGQENDELKNKRWSELLYDVINLAIENDNPDFSKYDGVIIFHAGIGSDFAFDFDATPYDIQSVYLDFETLQSTLGEGNTTYQGIDVGDGIFIKEGIILPEAQSQEGYELGLLGTMTLLMGSKLGMPSMFNTLDGSAGIGRWGLMDQGSYNMQGLIPAYPCAWMKVYLGWEEPVVVTHGTDLKIGTTTTASAPHIYKIPISSTEYFLVENRQTDPVKDEVTFGRDENGNRAQFDTQANVTADSELGVITSIDEYDFGLPGSGLLIWHIDENIINDSLATNSINNDREHRGVDLVESDGAQDLGYYYDLFSAASGAESGDYYDPYWADNESHKYVNNQTDTVALSPYTIPNSNANDGSKSHIHIFNISDNDTVMTFSVKNDRLVDGFPRNVGTEFFNGSLKTVGFNNNNYLVALSVDGRLFSWDINGEFYTEENLVLNIDDTFSLPPAVFPPTRTNQNRMVLAGQSGKLYLIRVGENFAKVDTVIDIQSKITAGPLILSNLTVIIVGTVNGELVIVDAPNYSVIDRKTICSNAITGLAYQSNVIAIISETGEYFKLSPSLEILDSKNISTTNQTNFLALADFDGNLGAEPMFASTLPAVGDMDNDGLPELFRQYQSDIRGYNYENSPVSNFPAHLTSDNLIGEKTSPLIAVTNEYGAIVINATLGGQLTAHDSNGDMVEGFPLSVGSAVHVSPILVDMDGDGKQECGVISTDGYFYLFDLDITLASDKNWTSYGGNNQNSFSVAGDTHQLTQSTKVLSEKGTYCYPNPADGGFSNIRYRLNQSVSAVSIRIYDIAGEFVEELTGSGTTPGDHEVRWDVSNVQSGAYLARIEASGSSDTSVQFIKIAVVK